MRSPVSPLFDYAVSLRSPGATQDSVSKPRKVKQKLATKYSSLTFFFEKGTKISQKIRVFGINGAAAFWTQSLKQTMK